MLQQSCSPTSYIFRRSDMPFRPIRPLHLNVHTKATFPSQRPHEFVCTERRPRPAQKYTTESTSSLSSTKPAASTTVATNMLPYAAPDVPTVELSPTLSPDTVAEYVGMPLSQLSHSATEDEQLEHFVSFIRNLFVHRNTHAPKQSPHSPNAARPNPFMNNSPNPFKPKPWITRV